MGARLMLEVVYATPEKQWLTTIDVPVGTSIRAAALAAHVEQQFPRVDVAGAVLGIFGERLDDATTRSRAVKAGDRIEIYRALTLDPKELRRAKVKERRRKLSR